MLIAPLVLELQRQQKQELGALPSLLLFLVYCRLSETSETCSNGLKNLHSNFFSDGPRESSMLGGAMSD